MVEVEGKDIANGVGVFDAVEAVDRRSAGIGLNCKVVVEFFFDLSEEFGAGLVG